MSDEDLLSKLKSLHARKGWLSGVLIDEMEDMPSSSSYAYRFGSLIRAYQIIGYTPDRDYRYIEINRHLRKIYPGIVESAIHQIEEMGGSIHREVTSDLIYVNDEISVSIIICRCFQTPAGRNRWKMRLDSGLRPDITIAIRMDETNENPLDYYVLPALDIESPKLRLADSNGTLLDSYRSEDLEDFFSLTGRTKIPEAA